MRREDVEHGHWPDFFRGFDVRNRSRPTRLGVMGGEGFNDYWLEDGLPLLGVSLGPEGYGAPRVEIMLEGASGEGPGHMTHAVDGVRRVTRSLSEDGAEEGLEVEGSDGLTTVLRFEPRAHE